MTSPSQDPSHRRSATRAPVGRPIKLQFDDSMEVIEGHCRNISIGGMFILFESSRPAGSLVRFELELDERNAIRGLGEVVWTRPSSAHGPEAGFGLKFRFLEQRDRQLIFKLVSQHIKDRLSKTEVPAGPPPAVAIPPEPEPPEPEPPEPEPPEPEPSAPELQAPEPPAPVAGASVSAEAESAGLEPVPTPEPEELFPALDLDEVEPPAVAPPAVAPPAVAPPANRLRRRRRLIPSTWTLPWAKPRSTSSASRPSRRARRRGRRPTTSSRRAARTPPPRPAGRPRAGRRSRASR